MKTQRANFSPAFLSKVLQLFDDKVEGYGHSEHGKDNGKGLGLHAEIAVQPFAPFGRQKDDHAHLYGHPRKNAKVP
tara:strand:+ start:19867 stop:20094 length:228 start_codon:yes stop_codon:yes gene_type:complete